MALEKISSINQIVVNPAVDTTLETRYNDAHPYLDVMWLHRFIEDGEEQIAQTVSERVCKYAEEADGTLTDYSNFDPLLRDICATIWPSE